MAPIRPLSWSTLRRTLLAAALFLPLAAFAGSGPPTPEDAERFVRDTEARLDKLGIRAQRAAWVQENFITDDTEAIVAQAQEEFLEASGEAALAARAYQGLALPPSTARKLHLLQLSLMFPDTADREAYARLAASLGGDYGKAKYCPPKAGKGEAACLPLGDLEKILAESRDPARLLDAWQGWHRQATGWKDRYAEYVALSNKGARAMGYSDTGALWRANYDMDPALFAPEIERIWQQVRPLYASMHEYARLKLRQQYGAAAVPREGPIPAHLFGNMWSQQWDHIYPILRPASTRPAFDLDKVLQERGIDAKAMTRYAEGFYTSLGMQKLPATFWERSLFTKPRDREVVCHASAWDLDNLEDVRIKMCIRQTQEDFTTIHHELGHDYYFLAYRDQPPLFRAGANDGFHEAIGDTVALSVTPAYLQKVGLMRPEQDTGDDIDLLLRRALEKIAFLPFGYLVDQWRWKVYSGEVGPADYDKAWWALREQVQGVARPLPMEPGGFDAGAKYHVAADVPYTRYFLSFVMQFQFHRALCREAGYTGPLHRCSIYGNRKAGEKFSAMLAAGASRPWQETLKAMTGEDRIDGNAILDYFAPLKTWLDAQVQEMSVKDPIRK
jgi:peptidyl-dipeptidase A